jgi:hypothetical protein
MAHKPQIISSCFSAFIGNNCKTFDYLCYRTRYREERAIYLFNYIVLSLNTNIGSLPEDNLLFSGAVAHAMSRD